MAIIRKSDVKIPFNEATIAEACARLYDQNYFKFFNFYYRDDHEADLFVISKSRRAVEIEVKISYQDWKADLKKGKHTSHKILKHFYYAVPIEMALKPLEGIDDRYGIIGVAQESERSQLTAIVIKRAKDLKGSRVPAGIVVKAFKSCYYKYSALRRKKIELQHGICEEHKFEYREMGAQLSLEEN